MRRWFNNSVLILILANCICKAAEDPLQRDLRQVEVLGYIDLVFMALFTLEAQQLVESRLHAGTAGR